MLPRMTSAQLHTLTGDITKLQVDAIVNAANQTLLGGGGVDGAIHRAAGPQLLAACVQLPELRPGVRCETGDAKLTEGFKLPARYVIHTVGPVWRGGSFDEERLLASCYRTCVTLASQRQAYELAFPAISCGVYGFPKDRACQIAVQTLRDMPLAELGMRRIALVAFDAEMLRLYEQALRAAR
jgi:O-acetyl-ADP-ribose deacetylase (regulator of RNase III)